MQSALLASLLIAYALVFSMVAKSMPSQAEIKSTVQSIQGVN